MNYEETLIEITEIKNIRVCVEYEFSEKLKYDVKKELGITTKDFIKLSNPEKSKHINEYFKKNIEKINFKVTRCYVNE